MLATLLCVAIYTLHEIGLMCSDILYWQMMASRLKTWDPSPTVPEDQFYDRCKNVLRPRVLLKVCLAQLSKEQWVAANFHLRTYVESSCHQTYPLLPLLDGCRAAAWDCKVYGLPSI